MHLPSAVSLRERALPAGSAGAQAGARCRSEPCRVSRRGGGTNRTGGGRPRLSDLMRAEQRTHEPVAAHGSAIIDPRKAGLSPPPNGCFFVAPTTAPLHAVCFQKTFELRL